VTERPASCAVAGSVPTLCSVLVGEAGFEPATPCSQIMRSRIRLGPTPSGLNTVSVVRSRPVPSPWPSECITKRITSLTAYGVPADPLPAQAGRVPGAWCVLRSDVWSCMVWDRVKVTE
jgi:hypothetical protein